MNYACGQDVPCDEDRMADESLPITNRWGRYWRTRQAFPGRRASKASIWDDRVMATRTNGVSLEREHRLWRATVALRCNTGAAEYEPVILRTGLPQVHPQFSLVEGANRYG